jgi:hypothetical protein
MGGPIHDPIYELMDWQLRCRWSDQLGFKSNERKYPGPKICVTLNGVKKWFPIDIKRPFLRSFENPEDAFIRALDAKYNGGDYGS